MMKKNYIKIVLDIVMAITFALLMNPRVLDGLPFHEIAGLVIGVAVLSHIGLNYRWVVNTTKKIFDGKLPKKTRFSYLLNLLLLVSMSTIIITGILISRVVFPSLGSGESHGIRGIHNLSANVTLALVGLHVALHWQWVMNMFKKAFKTKHGKLRFGVIAPVVLAVAILAGGMQWFASNSTFNGGSFMPKQMQQQTAATGNSNSTHSNGNFQSPVKGRFGDHHADGKFNHGPESPFLVLLNYLGIMTMIIIPAYYVEKRLSKKRRQGRNLQLQET